MFYPPVRPLGAPTGKAQPRCEACGARAGSPHLPTCANQEPSDESNGVGSEPSDEATVSAHELGGAAGGEIAGGDSHRSSHPGPRPREAASHMTSPTAAMTLIATAPHLSTDSPASAHGTTAAATPIQSRTIPTAYAQRARLAQML